MHTRNVQKEIKEVLKEVAAELDMDYKIVEDIYYHQFYYIAEQISKGEKNNASTFENILVKHLGSFVANEKHMNKLKEIADDRKIHEGEQLLGIVSRISCSRYI